jgi:hypothetical protein
MIAARFVCLLALALCARPAIADCVDRPSEEERPFGRIGTIAGADVFARSLSDRGFGGDPFFGIDLRIKKGGKTVEQELECSAFGSPELSIEGDTLVLRVDGTSYDGADVFTSFTIYALDPKTLQFKERETRTIDRVKELQAAFKAALKARDADAILKLGTQLADHHEGVRYPDVRAVESTRFETLAAGVDLANAKRKAGDPKAAAALVKRFLPADDEAFEDLYPHPKDEGEPAPKLKAGDVTRVLNDAAFVLEQGGEAKQASEILRKVVLTHEPSRVVAYRNLADAARKAGDEQTALLSEFLYAVLKKAPQPKDASIIGCAAGSAVGVNDGGEEALLRIDCRAKDGGKPITTWWTAQNGITASTGPAKPERSGGKK